MKQNIFIDLAKDVEALVHEISPRLVHIGGEDLLFRTGILWDDEHVITTAVSAKDGETVPVLLGEGKTITAVVQAFDSRAGIALLKIKEAKKTPAWEGETPRLGMLAVTVAFPSPEGPEARLEIVRCTGEGYFQTDGAAFPGFSGAAVLSASGKLLGIISSNAAGNRGQAIPFDSLVKLVAGLKQNGSRKRRVLGVRTQPVEEGLLVVEVAQGNAAQAAGLLVGDILLKVADREIKNPLSLWEALEESAGEVEITIKRGGQVTSVKATPQENVETTAWPWKHHGCCGR